MKRQIMKSLLALCAGVMTLCAASSLFTSCDKYDDSALREQIENLDNRVKAIENLKEQLTALSQKVDAALYTIEFDVNAENHLLYSLDGGKTWIDTGIVLAEECTCEPPQPCTCVPCDNPRITVVDNEDGSVTYTIGDHSFTVEVPEEIVFEIKAGKLYVASEGTQTVNIKTSGIDDISVIAAPKGWYAEITADGKLEITAPNVMDTRDGRDEDDNLVPATAVSNGFVKVHACSAEGKCMVGKLPVEVVMEMIAVKAYAGKYVIINETGWHDVFYGVSTKDKYLEDAQKVLDAYTNRDFDFLATCNFTSETIEGKLSDKLGYEPKAGEEYVVWAFDSNLETFTTDQLVLAFYSPVTVTVKENTDKKSAYDVYVSIVVDGAYEYYAHCIPGRYMNSTIDEEKERFAMEAPMGGPWAPGKLLKENYDGSVYSVAEGTQSSATGQGAPDQKCYLLILPLDGRPIEEYTAADVKSFEFTTGKLVAGLSTAVNAKQVTSYIEYGYEIVLDEYTQLGVEIAAPAESEAWTYLYSTWMSDEAYQETEGDDEVLIELILNDDVASYPRSRDEEFPYYSVNTVKSGETAHFIAFYVDKDGKYGPVTKLPLTSKKIETSDIAITDLATNLEDEVLLKNTTDLVLTPTTDLTATKYKYILTDISYSGNYFEENTPEELAEMVTFGRNALEVVPVDGKITIPGHEYGASYHLALLPYEGEKPGKAAKALTYDCDLIITAATDNFVKEPTVEFTVTERDVRGTLYADVAAKVTPATGSEVAAWLIDAAGMAHSYDYDIATKTADEKAAGLWKKDIPGGYDIQIFDAENTQTRTYNTKQNPTPKPMLLISWQADGVYYYKEIDPIAPAAPAEPTVATVAEFLAAEVDAEVYYQLTGEIVSIANTTYGNLTIKDETGEVYIYGLTAEKYSEYVYNESKDSWSWTNDKSFSTLELKVGDVLTLIGTRSAYGNDPQVGGAYHVSHVDGVEPPAEPADEVVSVESLVELLEIEIDPNNGFPIPEGLTLPLTSNLSASCTSATTPTRFWKDNSIRLYSTATFTLTATKNISKIEFVCSGNNKGPITASTGTVDGLVWTGDANEVTFTANGKFFISEVKVTYKK